VGVCTCAFGKSDTEGGGGEREREREREFKREDRETGIQRDRETQEQTGISKKEVTIHVYTIIECTTPQHTAASRNQIVAVGTHTDRRHVHIHILDSTWYYPTHNLAPREGDGWK
jgi:hypothetical protein